MVVKHRKLFPSQTDQTNQTAECLEFCDPDCPYPCYPDPLLYLSPPPPPPPLPPPAAAKHIPPYVIIVACLLVTFVLLLGYYFIIAKYCAIWHRSSSAAPPPSRHDEEEEEEEEIPMAVAAVDHPIWYIATVGLQQAIVNSITACKYKKGEGLIEGTECSVCLNEFREGETLRLLPKCSHAFHIPCIDTWLRSRTNCPLCRAPIVSNDAATNQDSRDSAQIEETQRGDFRGYGDQERSSVVSENRGRTEEVDCERTEEEDVANESKQGMDSNFSSNLDDLKQVKRSFSMDCASNQKVEAPKSDLGEVNLSMRREMGSSSMAEPVREKPVSMKRSLSCGGAPHVFFPET